MDTKQVGGVIVIVGGVILLVGAIKGTWRCVWDAAFGKLPCCGKQANTAPTTPRPSSFPGDVSPEQRLAPPSTAFVPSGWPGSGVTTS
jgi:hypothetical protein